MHARKDRIQLNKHILTVECAKEVFQQMRFCAVCLRPCFRIQIAGREYRHYWSRHRSEHARGGSIEAAKNHASSCFDASSKAAVETFDHLMRRGLVSTYEMFHCGAFPEAVCSHCLEGYEQHDKSPDTAGISPVCLRYCEYFYP